MLNSAQLKKIVAEARPLIEQQLDLTEQVAGLREVVTAAGGDWSQLKALVKAQIQDERDEAGDGKRVRKILDKADYAASYADMLGLAKMNEKNSFAEDEGSDPAFDRWLEEVADRVDPALLIQIIEGSKTAAGRAVIMAAIKVVQEDRADALPDHDPQTGEIIEPIGNGAGGAEGEAVANDAKPSAQPIPEAKATEDNAATAERDSEATAGRELQVGGAEPRASAATSELMDVTAGETAPTQEGSGPAEVHTLGQAGSTPAPATNSETRALPEQVNAEPGDGSTAHPSAAPVVANVVQLRSHNPETHFINSTGLARLHGCLKPDMCGSSQPRAKLCFSCSVKHDGPTFQAVAE